MVQYGIPAGLSLRGAIQAIFNFYCSSKDNDKEADIHYLENNYVTVVPTQFDMTCYQSLNELTKWNFNEI